MSRTRVSIRFDPVGPSSSISARGQVGRREDPRPQRVVDVVVDVGDAVDQLDDPPLQRRRLGRPGVVEDAVAHLLGEVEPLAVALQHVDHPQRVHVVLEAAAAALAQGRVERLLAGVAEGRVAEVVAEPDRLGQVLVEAERAGDGAGDPAGLQGVGEAGAVVIALGGDEDLGLVLEPAEGLRVDDPVAVALERRAQRAVGLLDARARRGIGRRRLGRRGTRSSQARTAILQRWRVGAPRGSILPSSGGAQAARARGARASRRPPARPGAAPARSASGASASGFASASTMKRWASSESAKEPASQLAQTTPPAAPEKPLRCSASPQRAQEASSGAKPAARASLRRKESAVSRPAARGCGRVVEQRQVAAEQVVGGRVGLGRVEQAQHRVAGAGAGGRAPGRRSAAAGSRRPSATLVTVSSSPRPSCRIRSRRKNGSRRPPKRDFGLRAPLAIAPIRPRVVE